MLMERSVHVMAVTLYVPGCFYFPFLKIHIFLTPLLFLYCSLDLLFHFCCFCKGKNALFSMHFL